MALADDHNPDLMSRAGGDEWKVHIWRPSSLLLVVAAAFPLLVVLLLPAGGSAAERANAPQTYTVPGVVSPQTGAPLPLRVSYSPQVLPEAIVGVPYDQKIKVSVNGASCTCIWENTSSLPPGLTLTNSTGNVQDGDTFIEVKGTPTVAGTSSFTTELFVPNFASRVNTCCPASWTVDVKSDYEVTPMTSTEETESDADTRANLARLLKGFLASGDDLERAVKKLKAAIRGSKERLNPDLEEYVEIHLKAAQTELFLHPPPMPHAVQAEREKTLADIKAAEAEAKAAEQNPLLTMTLEDAIEGAQSELQAADEVL